MSNRPFISVVLPTHNRVQEIRKAIDSVISQSFKDWELIIVDNFSSDGTREVVASFLDDRIKFFQFLNEGNIAKSRNVGIQRSKGQFIAFLDSDDYWFENKLEVAASYLLKGVDYFFSPMQIKHLSKGSLFRKKKFGKKINEHTLFFKYLLLEGNIISTSSMVVKKSLLKEVNCFDTRNELIAGEDYDLWIRISFVSNNFHSFHKILGVLTSTDSSASNSDRALRWLSVIENNHLPRLNQKEASYMKKRWLDFAKVFAKWDAKQEDLTIWDCFKCYHYFLESRKSLILTSIIIDLFIKRMRL